MFDQIENRLIHKQTIDKIGSFYFYDHFMVSEINEGVIVSMEMVLKFSNKYTKKYYPVDKPFVYIANRINSYSLDPTIHLESKNLLPNTRGFAAVAYNRLNYEVATIEQLFLNIPTKIFSSLKDAVIWANEIIKE